jgi:hypothetical protein
MIGVLAARRHGAYSFLTCARTQTFIQRYMETLEQRIQRVAQEDVAITPYDPRWPELFRQEKGHLLNCLPNELIRRIEHFGLEMFRQYLGSVPAFGHWSFEVAGFGYRELRTSGLG